MVDVDRPLSVVVVVAAAASLDGIIDLRISRSTGLLKW